ncbi:MAG: hypothetical protein AAGA50_11205 [Pseudomonadota bacterium]
MAIDRSNANHEQAVSFPGDGSRGLLTFLTVSSLAGFCLLAWWLFSIKVEIASDDAYYFSRALTRFSILDYSPHFPGYPAFVALGRLSLQIWSDPVSALINMTVLASLALPIVAAAIAWRWTGSPLASIVCFALVLAQPILPLVALSGLSDSVGMLFLLCFFAALPDTEKARKHDVSSLVWCLIAGIALGVSGAARPSYGVILIGAFLPVALWSLRSAAAVVCGVLVVGIPAMLVLISLEGWNYLHEGWRFFNGHMFEWGNTVFAGSERSGWTDFLSSNPAFAAITLLYLVLVGYCLTLGEFDRRQVSLPVAILVAVIWTIFFQNPENLRHLLPLLTLSAVLIAVRLHRATGVVSASITLIFLSVALVLPFFTTAISVRAPLAGVIDTINAIEEDVVVLAHRDVSFLRSHLDRARVYDLAFPANADAALAASNAAVVSITTQQAGACVEELFFAGRVFGEPGLWICTTRATQGLR